jgi:hypothetical protein
MATYKNDYDKEEDEMLWELHQIRREIHLDFKNKSSEQINNEAMAKFARWKSQTGAGENLQESKSQPSA